MVKIPPEDTGSPVVTVFEIQLGIEGLRLQCKVGNADEIEGWLEGLLEANGDYIIVPGVDVVRLQARMFSTPALRNFLRPEPRSTKLQFGGDLLVAATAIVHKGLVVTFNVYASEGIICPFPLQGLFHQGIAEWI